MPSAAGMHYFIHSQENSNRPPVILLHGAGGTHLNWPPQLRRLDGQPMLAVDLPGHGNSEGVGRQTISDYSADLLRFLDALGLPAAVFVGHSMGAAIALTLALDHPKRVLGLALLGAGARMRVSPSILEAAAHPGSFREAVQAITELGYSRHASARLKELAGERMAKTRPPVFYGDFLACDAFDVSNRLAKIKAPTLVLGAEDDILMPLWYARSLGQQIPGAQYRVIARAGHMLMLEQPEAVTSALADFLAALPDRPGVRAGKVGQV